MASISLIRGKWTLPLLIRWNQTCGCIPNGRAHAQTRHAAFMLASDSPPEKNVDFEV